MNCVAGWPFWGMPLNDHAPPAVSWHKNCAPIKGKPSLQLLSRKGGTFHHTRFSLEATQKSFGD